FRRRLAAGCLQGRGMAFTARLLLVDDDEKNGTLLCHGMIRSGYHVDLAKDGSQALDLIHSRPYDLVLLGCSIAGIGSLELLRRIRAEWSASTLPVIMVTAVQNSAVSALQLGANDYVIQPLDLARVMARIETQLKLALTGREARYAD